MSRNITERGQRIFFFCSSYLARLLVCLNWAFNIPDYHLFTASKSRAFLLVQVALLLEGRKASLKWRRPIKYPKAEWEIQKSSTSNIFICIFRTDWTESRWRTFREIKKLSLSLRTCSNMPSAPRSLTCALIIGVESYSEERKKKESSFRYHMDKHMLLPPLSQRCLCFSKLLLLYSLTVLILPICYVGIMLFAFTDLHSIRNGPQTLATNITMGAFSLLIK